MAAVFLDFYNISNSPTVPLSIKVYRALHCIFSFKNNNQCDCARQVIYIRLIVMFILLFYLDLRGFIVRIK